MRNRILEIAESPCRLRIDRQQLVIDERDAPPALFRNSVPLDDLAVVIVAHPQVSYTQAVLCEFGERGIAFIPCNGNRMPVGMLLPLDANSVQTSRFRAQVNMKLPLKKQLWKQVVQAKIRMQSRLLIQTKSEDRGIGKLGSLVKSGDPANVEARAARKYWMALFGKQFLRDRDAENQNRFLNYGYAILRAATTRAICAAGLHPSLGIHHHNQYNSWCLADDLMEPFRPMVDRIVSRLVLDFGSDAVMDQPLRASLIRCLLERVFIGQRQRTVIDALSVMSDSLVHSINSGQADLVLPEEFADARS